MSLRIDDHELVDTDLEHTWNWYEDRERGLGDRFLGAIRAGMDPDLAVLTTMQIQRDLAAATITAWEHRHGAPAPLTAPHRRGDRARMDHCRLPRRPPDVPSPRRVTWANWIARVDDERPDLIGSSDRPASRWC